MNRVPILCNPSRLLLLRSFCSNNGADNASKTPNHIELPPEPTTCCMSGCQNCVWVQYANELTKLLDDSGEHVREIVLAKISDPSLKMFLRMELQSLDSVRKDPPDDSST